MTRLFGPFMGYRAQRQSHGIYAGEINAIYARTTNARAMCAILLATLALATSSTHAQSPADLRTALTQGVVSISAPGGLPGSLTILDKGYQATTLVSGRQDRGRAPIVVAAQASPAGRVAVYSHDNFLNASGLADAGDRALLANLARWTAGEGHLRVGLVNEDEAAPTLTAAYFTVTKIAARDLSESSLAQVDVLIANPDAFDGPQSAAHIAAVQKWVRAGHGLITFGVGWGWLQLHPGASLNEAGFNRLLVPLAGVGVNGDTVEPTGAKGAFAVEADSNGASITAESAVDRLEAGAAIGPRATAAISRVLSQALDVLPDDEATLRPRLNALIAKGGSVVPTKAHPIGLDNPTARLAAALEARNRARTPAAQITAAPSAIEFPGPVPAGAPRVTRTVTVDERVPEWHSTGLYAAPGEVVTVTVPADAARAGLGVRIGAHRDTLWNLDKWPRFPEITVEKPLRDGRLEIASAFGGTIYVTVPAERQGHGEATRVVPVTIANAVAQPYFVRGKTSLKEWKATLRDAPAPWAELQGDRVILTVPSSVVRTLDDPDALMRYWDGVADAAADLYAIPHKRRRQERYCADVEISAGYMHSGYPIMTHDDVAPTFTDLAVLRGPNGLKTWGFYHELGHNHQQSAWTWDGLGEVTNNLFSLYGDEKFNGVRGDYTGDFRNSHPAVAPLTRHKRLVEYVARGVTPDGETVDPFLALTLFIELRQAFGWEPFTSVFGQYQHLSEGARPYSEIEKRDRFMLLFSRAIGRDLGPFFTAWGVTTSDAARKSIAKLPPWMPPDWPTAAEVAAARSAPAPATK